MNTQLSLAAEVANHSSLAGAVAKRFSSRPSLYASALKLLTEQMRAYYPNLTFRPEQTWLAEPQYPPALGGGPGYRLYPVVALLIGRYLADETLNLDQDYHFLTDQYASPEAGRVKVRMYTFERLFDEAVRVLMVAYQNDLKDFWNEVSTDGDSRWAWLSRYLQDGFAKQANAALARGTLNAEQLATAQALATTPESEDRQRADARHPVQAWLLNVDSARGTTALVSTLTPLLVVSRHLQVSGRDCYVVYNPFATLQGYDTLQALADDVGAQLGRELTCQQLQMSLVALQAHAFDAQAQALLEQQLHLIDLLGPACRAGACSAAELTRVLDDVTTFNGFEAARQRAGLASLAQALPVWLVKAPAGERSAYAERIGKLALVRQRAGGRTFLDGIADIQTFTAQALLEQIRVTYPRQPAPVLDDVQVHVVTVPNALLSIVNAGDTQMQAQVISLVDLALFQAARPRGHLVIKARPGAQLPAWMDVAAVERLIASTNAGQGYIQLLKQKLQGYAEASWREALFTEQLREQLPLLALEYALRAEQGFTTQGYELVADLFAPAQACPPVPARLRKLAFSAREGAAPDIVGTMFVVDRAGSSGGTCVLYRPLMRQPLREFSSEAALFNAICDPGDLQDSVLAWLPAPAQARYGRGGFAEPHVERFGNGLDTAPLRIPKPARLNCQPCAGPLLPGLYHANVKAMIEVADRQSISTTESRWLAYSELGWVLFNALLPLAGGPLATAGWMIQTLSALDRQLAANPGGDPAASSEAVTELMFNIALYLMGEGLGLITRGESALGGPVESIARPPAGSQTLTSTLTRRPPVAQGSVGAVLPTQLDFSFTNASRQLTAAQQVFVASLRVKVPAHLGEAIPRGPQRGLYWHASQLLAPVGAHLFSVVADDGVAQVVDPATGSRVGPWLRRDELGRWQFDSRLRLLGGGPGRKTQQLRAQAATADNEALLTLAEYSARYPALFARSAQLAEQLRQPQAASAAQLEALRTEYIAQTDDLVALMVRGQAARERINRHSVMARFNEQSARAYESMVTFGVNIGAVMLGQMGALRLAHPTFLAEPGVDEGASASANEAVRTGIIALLERHLAWRERVDGWMASLERIPGHGPQARARLEPILQSHKTTLSITSILLQMRLLVGLRAFNAEPALLDPLATLMRPVRMALISHAQLDDPAQVFDREAQLTVLNSVLESYAQALDGASMMREAHASDAWEALEPFLSQLSQLLQSTQRTMATLVRAQVNEVQDNPVAAVPASNRVVMRLGNRRVLIGRRRARQGASDREVVEVADPLNEAVVASYQQAADGQWSELPAAAPAAQPRPVNRPALRTVLRNADARLEQVESQISRGWAHARHALRPVEVEEDLNHQADLLSDSGDAIQALLDSPDGVPLPARHQLARNRVASVREAVARMREQGRRMRVQRTLELLPQSYHVRYLLEQQAIRIEALPERRFMDGAWGRKDYVDEYAIKDLQGRVVWYAHFHYAAKDSPIAAFSTAHLKLASQRKVGLQRQIAQARNDEEVTAIWRGILDAASARELFLALREPPP